jgi:thiamine-phosphate diphosphorylase / hydroxyethylthiazole kinase
LQERQYGFIFNQMSSWFLSDHRSGCIVVMTGVSDYLTDGQTVIKLSNGHPLLGDITGSGCMIGTAVATFCGADNVASAQASSTHPGRLYGGNPLLSAAAAVLAVTIASEIAAARDDVHGLGTFLPALLDEISKLTPEVIRERARVEVL